MDDDVKLYSVEVDRESTTHSNDDGELDGGAYSYRGTTDTSWRFLGLTKGDDLSVTFEPVYGRRYYLLLALYSTGDSFGHDNASNVEFLDLYETEEAAYNAERSIKYGDKNSSDWGARSRMTFTNHQGASVTTYCPWSDYFSSLDDIQVKSLVYKGES